MITEHYNANFGWLAAKSSHFCKPFLVILPDCLIFTS